MPQQTIQGTLLAVAGTPETTEALAGQKEFAVHRPDETGIERADVLVIGPATEQPLATARRLRRQYPLAQVVFIVPHDRLERFRTMLPFDPDLGDAWTTGADASPETIRGVVRDALRVAVDRRRTTELNDRVNQLLDRFNADAERQRREMRLNFSAAYLGRLLWQAPDPIFATTAEGELVAWNDAAIHLFGQPADTTERVSLLDRVPRARRRQVTALLQRVAKGESVAPLELRLESADGRRVDLELMMAPIVDPSQDRPYVSFVGRDVTERRRAESNLRAALAEKDVLLREVHHRVKNNLQVITSLLRLRARSLAPEMREPFLESTARIQAMANLHDRLSASENFVTIELAPFLRDLCLDLAQTFGMTDRVDFQIAQMPVTFDLESATPIALILAELVTNALKHAFPGGRQGVITVTGRQLENGTELTVADNGVGFGQDADQGKPARSLGLKVIQALAGQINGKLTVTSNGNGTGTTAKLVLPRVRDAAAGEAG